MHLYFAEARRNCWLIVGSYFVNSGKMEWSDKSDPQLRTANGALVFPAGVIIVVIEI